MAKHEIFYAICDLFNEGKTTIEAKKAIEVINASELVLPEFRIRAGLYDPVANAIGLYVENYEQAKG